MMGPDAKIGLLDHSRAKVELYTRYLSIYLNILERAPSVDRVLLFDLLAGEGKYADGSRGSAVAALDVIRDHYSTTRKSSLRVEIWLNDRGMSEIEKGISKIDRIRRYASERILPSQVKMRFDQKDYRDVFPLALKNVEASQKSRSLFFVDPYGYKDIDPDDLKSIMATGRAEILLFLPTSFMYRFAGKALESPFPGSEALIRLLRKLYGPKPHRHDSVEEFIGDLRARFKEYLGGVYATEFAIERDASNVYCLFYFTTHILGLEKMLEAKWSLDKERGTGHRREKSGLLFSEVERRGYPRKLRSYIEQEDFRTNEDLYRFGLEHGFLPRHTNEVLLKWKKQGVLDVFPVDSRLVKGFYIRYKSDRRVGFRFQGKDSRGQEKR
jgi:three-Cys-motif partner protein